ncbi:MAG: hypothetical protein HY268_17850 [Deltaproteobacteria bacterium]|nr:hypothetical protein [Deltaproteobacteria bacterium]
MTWLSDGDVTSKSPDDTQIQVQTASLPADSAELVQLLTSSSDWDRELPINQLRSAIHLLTRTAERHANRLHDFDEIRYRVSTLLEKVAQIPWLAGNLPIDQYLSLSPNISVEGALEHFAAIEQEATHLLRLHDQLETLISRLGGEPSPCMSREVTNLKDIAVCLEERVTNLTERLQEIGLREERVAEFFDRLTAVDQENAQQLIEDTDLLRWVEILWFHTASTLITDAGRRYERLMGRFDLVGLIIAHLWRLNDAKAIEIAHTLVSKQERALTGRQLIEALMWLTPLQLQAIRDACASDLSDTAEMVLAGVTGSSRPEQHCAPSLLPADFGQRCAITDEGEVIVLNAKALVRPTMTQSWPVAITQGAVPLSSLLGDYFREALGTAPTSLRGAVAEFLRRGELRAAWEAAAGDFELQQSVAEELKNKKSTTLKDYAGLLKEAQDARIHNEYINLCLTEMENAFNAFDFHQAMQRLNELQSLVQRFNALRDPTRVALVEFLEEAGLPVHNDESLEQLQQYAAALRDRHRNQRLHLLQLEHAAKDERLLLSLRDAWADLARRLDRPAYWPSEENSRALADAIDTFVRFILGKLRYKADDPATADMLVGRLEQWIRAQLYTGLVAEEGGRNAAIQALSDLAEEIEEFALDTHVLRVVSASELTLRFPQDSIDVRE